MKFFAIAALAALGVSNVVAAPFRVVVVTPNGVPQHNRLESARFGHAIPPEVARVTLLNGSPDMAHVKPCHGRHRLNRFREKALEISNKLRLAFGLPAIEAHSHHEHHVSRIRILPFIGTPNLIQVDQDMKNHTDKPDQPAHHHAHHHHHHHHHHRHGKDSFFGRIHSSLMNLGRWEGRAVAFVLGCGIGVLLRMLWVLGLIAYRSLKGGEETEYITIVEEYVPVPLASPPPTYTYPVDEKASLEADVKKPAAEEETK